MASVDRIEGGHVYVSDGVILGATTLACAGVWVVAWVWGLPL